MNIRIDPPLEGRHKGAILLMVLAGALAAGLATLALEHEERRETQAWKNRQEVRHGRH